MKTITGWFLVHESAPEFVSFLSSRLPSSPLVYAAPMFLTRRLAREYKNQSEIAGAENSKVVKAELRIDMP